MRNLIFITLVCLLTTSLRNDPGDGEEIKDKRAYVTGKISNPAGVKVMIYKLPPLGNAAIVMGHDSLDKKGRFVIQLKLEQPSFCYFKHGEEQTEIYLSPGDSIHLVLDTKSFDESLKYTGKGSVANNYLASKLLLEEKIMPDVDIYTKGEKGFRAHMDSVKIVLENHYYKSLVVRNDGDSLFRVLALENLRLTHAATLLPFNINRLLENAGNDSVNSTFPSLRNFP